ncbi:ABC transporter substrate-binding protein [Clostridium pasteurianum]|uniref:ABC-type sugar transport system, periplasmic component n=1 Tax=Clostridium pasteurianum BC1 TaxID=86416 RepID=R4JYJ1_CLOPA|nr:ABC transporter substrate-binding protein [Clostridium pasteurianum]AGK95363.1 ABC-type sugar transport system, periplasmic component [Clostridium pasteurianum BC1]
MKKIIIILVVVFMSMSLVSCDTKSKNSSVEEIKGKVNIWTTDANEALINDAMVLFKKKYPHVYVNISTLAEDKLEDNLSNSLKEKVNLPDIVVVRDKNVPVIINKFEGSFLDASSISQFNKDIFIKNQINNNTYKNKVYAVPLYVEPTFMLYREDILGGLNIKSEDIKTWQQYIDIGVNPVKSNGKLMLSSDYFNNGAIYDLALRQLGVSYFNKDKKIDLLNEKAVKAADLLNNIYNSKISQDDKESTDKIQSFVRGDTVSLLCNLSTMYNIQNKYPDLSGKLKAQKIPAFEQGGNRDNINFGDNLMLLKTSENNSAALEFTKFLSSNEELSAYEYTRYGFMSSNINSYSDDSFYKKNIFYNNENIGRMAIDEILGLRNMQYSYNFNIIRNKVLQTIIDTSINGKPLNDSLYNLQTSLEQTDELK